MSNGHIKRYLDQYMAMSQTDFAVFITGEWGCGKTFFFSIQLWRATKSQSMRSAE